MRILYAFAAAGAVILFAGSASAQETGASPFGQPLGAATMGAERGGTEVVGQGNSTSQNAANLGSMTVANDAAKWSGLIAPASILGNQGITTVMQNTGDMVNLTNATSVNVYMH